MEEFFDDINVEMTGSKFPGTNLSIICSLSKTQLDELYIIGIKLQHSHQEGIPMEIVSDSFNAVKGALVKSKEKRFNLEEFLPPVLVKIISEYIMPEFGPVKLYYSNLVAIKRLIK